MIFLEEIKHETDYNYSTFMRRASADSNTASRDIYNTNNASRGVGLLLRSIGDTHEYC